MKIKGFVFKKSYDRFLSGEIDFFSVSKNNLYDDSMGTQFEQMEVHVSKLLEVEQQIQDELPSGASGMNEDAFIAALDDVSFCKRLSVMSAIEELEQLLMSESDIAKKKDLITLLDYFIWGETQLNKLKGLG